MFPVWTGAGKMNSPLQRAWVLLMMAPLKASAGRNGNGDIENNIIYDKNGNIKTLNRTGSAIDNLTYTYRGNRLSSLTDAA